MAFELEPKPEVVKATMSIRLLPKTMQMLEHLAVFSNRNKGEIVTQILEFEIDQLSAKPKFRTWLAEREATAKTVASLQGKAAAK